MATVEDLEAELRGVQDAMVHAITALTARVDALAPPEERGTPPPPARWADRATPDDWQLLADWVDDLNRSYSLTSQHRIHPCWPAHPGVVEELAAAHHAWTAATISHAKNGPHPAEPAQDKKPAKPARPAKGGPEYAAWHNQVLWPFLERIRSDRYRIHLCKTGHSPETTNIPDPTDRTAIPIAP